jgi:hypothetical protein
MCRTYPTEEVGGRGRPLFTYRTSLRGLSAEPKIPCIERLRLLARRRLLRPWKDADLDIPILQEAKAEYAKIQ